MTYSNADLALAFPAAVRDDALHVASALTQPILDTETFSVCAGGETVHIPYRIYHDPALINREDLTPIQKELLDCLFTRHHDGVVREKHLRRIICSHHAWIPPFVVQLVGEYVIEILDTIRDSIGHLEPELYQTFLRSNPEYFALTQQRAESYWNCNHRHTPRGSYSGFQIVDYFVRLAGSGNIPEK